MKALLTIWILAVLIQEVVPSTLVRRPRTIHTEKSSSVQTEYEAKYEQKGKHGNESLGTLSGKQHFVHEDCSGNWNAFADKCASLIKDLVASLANVVSSKPGDATNLQLHIKNTFRHFDNTHNCSCLNHTGLDLSPLLNNLTKNTLSPGANGNNGGASAPGVVAVSPVSQGGHGDSAGSGLGPGTIGQEILVPQKQVKPNGLVVAENLDPANVGNSNDLSNNNRREVNYPQVSRQPGNGVGTPPNGKLPLPLLVTPRPAKTPVADVRPIPASPVYTGPKTPAVLIPDDNSSGGSLQNTALPASSSNNGNGMPSSASQLLDSPGTGHSATNKVLPVTGKPFSNGGIGAPSSSGAGQQPINTPPVVAVAEPVNRNHNSPVAVPVAPATGAGHTKPAIVPLTRPAFIPTVPVTNTQNADTAVEPAVVPVTDAGNTKPAIAVPANPVTTSQNSEPSVVLPVKNTEPSVAIPVINSNSNLPESSESDDFEDDKTVNPSPIIESVLSGPSLNPSSNAVSNPSILPSNNEPLEQLNTVPVVANGQSGGLGDSTGQNEGTLPVLASPLDVETPITDSQNSGVSGQGHQAAVPVAAEIVPAVPVTDKQTPEIGSGNSDCSEKCDENGSNDEISIAPVVPVNSDVGGITSTGNSGENNATPVVAPISSTGDSGLNEDIPVIAPISSTGDSGLNNDIPVVASSTSTGNSGNNEGIPVAPISSSGDSGLINATPVVAPISSTGDSGLSEDIPVIAPISSTGDSGLNNAGPVVASATSTANSGLEGTPVVASATSTGDSGLNNDVPVVAPISSTGDSGLNEDLPVIAPISSTGDSGLNNDVPVVASTTSTGNSGQDEGIPVVAPISSSGDSGLNEDVPVVAPISSTGDSGLNNGGPVVAPISSTGNSANCDGQTGQPGQAINTGVLTPLETKEAVTPVLLEPEPVVPAVAVPATPAGGAENGGGQSGHGGNSGLLGEGGQSEPVVPAVAVPATPVGGAENGGGQSGHGGNSGLLGEGGQSEPVVPAVAVPATPVSGAENGGGQSGQAISPAILTPLETQEAVTPVLQEPEPVVPAVAVPATPVLGGENGGGQSGHGGTSGSSGQEGGQSGQAIGPAILTGLGAEEAVTPVLQESEPVVPAVAVPATPVGGAENGGGQSGQAISPAVLTPLETQEAVTPVLQEPEPVIPAVAVPATPVVGAENGGGQSGSLGQGGQSGGEDPVVIQPTTFQTTSGQPTPPSPVILNPTETSNPISLPSVPQESGESLLVKPLTSPQTPVYQEDDDEDCCSCESCTEEEISDPKQFKDAACKNLEEARIELKRIIDKITKKLKCGRKAPQTITTSVAVPLAYQTAVASGVQSSR